MTKDQLQSLKDGDVVVHSDGTRGTVDVDKHYGNVLHIQWDDGQSMFLHTDSLWDIAWAETDIEKVTA